MNNKTQREGENEYEIVGTITFMSHKKDSLVVKLCGTSPGYYAKLKDSEYNLFWDMANEKQPEIKPVSVQVEFTVHEKLSPIVTDLALKKQKAKIHVTILESKSVVGVTIEPEG